MLNRFATLAAVRMLAPVASASLASAEPGVATTPEGLDTHGFGHRGIVTDDVIAYYGISKSVRRVGRGAVR